MSDRTLLERLFEKHQFTDFRWIDPRKIVVSRWVRMKCMFGCPGYGNACCPPNTPSVDECKKFFEEYTEFVVFHFQKKVEKPEDRYEWTKEINARLLKLEREVFLAGNPKTFLLFMDTCAFCLNCATLTQTPGERSKCNDKRSARPVPEAMAVDVFSTVKQLDYPIEVLKDYSACMNRYAFLLVE